MTALQKYKGLSTAVFGAFFIGLQGITIQSALSEANEPLVLLTIRNILFIIVSLTLISLKKKHLMAKPKRAVVKAMLIGCISFFLSSLLSIIALQTLDPATERFIFMSYPVYFLVLFGIARIGYTHAFIVLLLYIIGMIFLLGISFDGSIDIKSIVLAIGSSVSFAVYLMLIEKYKHFISMEDILLYGSTGSFLLCILLLSIEYDEYIFDTIYNISFLFDACIYTSVCYAAMWLTGIATHIEGSYKVSFVSALAPLFSGMIVFFMPNSHFSSSNLAGGLCVIFSVIIANKKRNFYYKKKITF